MARSSVNAPDWLPNWRDESQYPALESDSISAFAWEFLRRNEAYQTEYKQVCGTLSVPEEVKCAASFQALHPLCQLGRRWGFLSNIAAQDPSLSWSQVYVSADEAAIQGGELALFQSEASPMVFRGGFEFHHLETVKRVQAFMDGFGQNLDDQIDSAGRKCGKSD